MRGGVFRLIDIAHSFEPPEAESALGSWISSGPSSGDAWTQADLIRHLRDEHSTFSWLLEPMLERAGFEIRDRRYSDSQVFPSYVCVRR